MAIGKSRRLQTLVKRIVKDTLGEIPEVPQPSNSVFTFKYIKSLFVDTWYY